MGYSADRSDFLFGTIAHVKNHFFEMDEEHVLFGVERVLLDSVKVLENNSSDPDTLDLLFDTVSHLGNKRLGIPGYESVLDVVEHADRGDYKELLENKIRPVMYEKEMAQAGCGGKNRADTIFIYRCFNAASLIAEYDCNRVPGYDFKFTVDAARVARDVVGEWLMF